MGYVTGNEKYFQNKDTGLAPQPHCEGSCKAFATAGANQSQNDEFCSLCADFAKSNNGPCIIITTMHNDNGGSAIYLGLARIAVCTAIPLAPAMPFPTEGIVTLKVSFPKFGAYPSAQNGHRFAIFWIM